MEQDRAEVELTIQIGMETDAEVLAVLMREAKKATRRALGKGRAHAEYVDETQWCSGAMRVTVRRPNLPPPPAKQPPTAWCPRPECSEGFQEIALREGKIPFHDFPKPCRSLCSGSLEPPLREPPPGP